MTASVDEYLVCGDKADEGHRLACVLGIAESVAAEAIDAAASTDRHWLIAALTALHEAGLLHTDRPPEPMVMIEGFLDDLYEAGLIGAPAAVPA